MTCSASGKPLFSYCLNDAKALGAITFFPTHMFCTKVGARFVVDNYTQSSFRFSSPGEIIDKIKSLVDNPKEMAYESYKSRQYVIDNHSIDTVSENWRSIFLDARRTLVSFIFMIEAVILEVFLISLRTAIVLVRKLQCLI